MDDVEIPEMKIERAEMERVWEQLHAENDTLSVLLKAHLYSEYWLELLLEGYLGEKKREPLQPVRLRFAQKLTLVDTFALLPVECVRSLSALNKLRNDCVHRFNTRPTIEDVRKVGSHLMDFPPVTQHLHSVVDVLEAYMMYLLGYFSAAKYDLEHQVPR